MPTPSDLLRQLSERGRPRGAPAVFAAAATRRAVPRRALVAAAVVLAVVAAGGVVVASDGTGPGVGVERAEVAEGRRRTTSSTTSGAALPPPGTDGAAGAPPGDTVTPLDDGEAVTTRLESHPTCDSVLQRLRQLGRDAVGPYGFDGGVHLYGQPGAGGAPAAGEAPMSPGSASETGGDTHSASNVQEAGVDEPDLVKTDGGIVVALARGRLQVVSVAGRSLAGSTELGFPPSSLLLAGRTAAVIGVPDFGADGRRPETPVALVGLEDPAAPALRSTTWIEGIVTSARMEDGMVRLVVADAPRFDWRSPADGSPGAAEAAEAENRRLVDSSPLAAWLPDQRTVDPAGQVVSRGPAAACQTTYTPSEESGLDTTTVVTLDPATGALHPGTAVAASPYVVYATQQSLYVVSSTCCPQSPDDVRADIHRFDLSHPTAAPYRSSGSVPGTPINQFALSERDGHLRVATTLDRDGTGGDPTVPADTDSAVWVLAERGADLALVGHVAGLGKPGERIQAVRYHDRFAYVVTFRRTDPLYVVDLRDPTAPAVLGALEIPGFSSFLQATGPGQLMGVGRSVDPDTAQDLGLQFSLFDVSDPAAPARSGAITYRGAHSAAEHDHLAFLHWEPEDLVVVPFIEAQDPESCGWVAGALMVRARDGSLSEVARVSHSAHAGGGDGAMVPIHRAAVAGGSLLTVSDLGLAFGDLRTGAEQAFVTFAGPQAPAHHAPCGAEPAPPQEEEPGGILPA